MKSRSAFSNRSRREFFLPSGIVKDFGKSISHPKGKQTPGTLKFSDRMTFIGHAAFLGWIAMLRLFPKQSAARYTSKRLETESFRLQIILAAPNPSPG